MELAATRATGPGRSRGAHGARAMGKGREVPARIMAPRVILYVTAFGLTAFGLLMIYSASSIMCLTSSTYNYDPAYFVERQALFAGVGLVLAIVLARVDYRVWRGMPLKVVWVATLLLLGLIYTPIAGSDAYGATRWISLGGLRLQPSELAKVTVLLTAANLCKRYYQDDELDRRGFLKLMFVGVVIPLGLILLQPDKGTTGIIVLTVLVMLYLAGMPRRWVWLAVGLGVAGAAVLALKDDYSRARVLTMIDPFKDPYGDGYQLVQGFYAFGTGGLFGVGLGLSRQKYSYLPMAHNDFIFAVIGEELGLVGTLGTLAAFALLIWAGFKIAEGAPDLTGRLVAAGCTSLIAIQLLLNVCGVLGMFPLSGKPVPFISYGGTSIISCLMLVGLVASVSRQSTLPETEAERRRSQLRLVGREGLARGGVGESPVRPREANPSPGTPIMRGETTSPRGGLGQTRYVGSAYQPQRRLSVVEGGRNDTARVSSGGRSRERVRVDLDADPAARLRSDDVQVRDGRPSNRRR